MATAALAVAAVGWFVAPNIKELMDRARSYVRSNVVWYTGLPEKLDELAEALSSINTYVAQSQQSRLGLVVNNEATIRHLWELKDAIHDAEELLNTFQYQILQANLAAENNERRYSVVGSRESLKELEKLLVRLDMRSQDLLHISQFVVPATPRPTMGHLRRCNQLFGYDKEYCQLKSRLRGSGDYTAANVEFVAIVGHGGMGKTELAQWAFHDAMNNDKSSLFDLCIWVSVYGKFNQDDLLMEIWRSVPNKTHADGLVGTSVANIQQALEKKVTQANRYLLVLDDVCNDESVEASNQQRRIKTWNTVLAPFKQPRKHGSQILMTTRAEICAKTLGAAAVQTLGAVAMAQINLRGIDAPAIKGLLQKTASDDGQASLTSELQSALQANVDMLHGSPLAAEIRACRFKPDSYPTWSRGSKRRIWTNMEVIQKHVDDDIFDVHLSSYRDLPPQLQRCFAFCSIFPKSWMFERAKLTKMWVALGFVEGTSDGMTVEHVARGYFDALAQRSLFQEATSNRAYKGQSSATTMTRYYAIHEQIHSMIRRVCPNYYLSIESKHSMETIPLTVRHLSVTTGCLDLLKAWSRLRKLRTLLVFGSSNGGNAEIDKGIIQKFMGLRVLDLSDTCASGVPEGIGRLKHLRYLGLPNTITELGTGITKLLLLQTLSVVSNGCMLKRLPQDMSRLINLRHLDLGMEYIAQIAGIGRMTMLQESVEFHAGRQKGHSMRELGELNSLHRKLSIKGLETVKSKGEVESAQLKNKVQLNTLELQWSDERRAEVGSTVSDFKVLKGLRPHHNLENLHIQNYTGKVLPSWLEDLNLMKKLRSLHLSSCRKLKRLPLMGRLSHLKFLDMTGLHSISKIDDSFCRSGDFASLEEMVLEDMAGLVSWSSSEGSDGHTPILFPQLKKVTIVNCRLLSTLSGLLYCRWSLMYLQVERCPQVKENFERTRFRCLDKLEILGCPGLCFIGRHPVDSPHYSRKIEDDRCPPHQTTQYWSGPAFPPSQTQYWSGPASPPRHPTQGGDGRHSPPHQTQDWSGPASPPPRPEQAPPHQTQDWSGPASPPRDDHRHHPHQTQDWSSPASPLRHPRQEENCFVWFYLFIFAFACYLYKR